MSEININDLIQQKTTLICEEKQQKQQQGNSAHDCLVQTQYEFLKF